MMVSTIQASSSIKRIDGKIRYYEHKGVRYPSITAVLNNTADKTGLEAWRKRVGDDVANYIMMQAAKTGTITHSMIECRLSGGEFGDKYPLLAMGHYLNLIKYMEKIDKIRGLEIMMYSDELMVAGTADCVANYDGVASIIDFKTKRSSQKTEWIQDYFLQCAAYGIMYEENYGEAIRQGVVLVSVENGDSQVFYANLDDYKERLIARIGQFGENSDNRV